MGPAKGTVYLAHAVRARTMNELQDNLASARAFLRILTDLCPFAAISAPWLAHVEAHPDLVGIGDGRGRARGMRDNLALLRRGAYDEIWCTGPDMTQGMVRELLVLTERGGRMLDLVGIPCAREMLRPLLPGWATVEGCPRRAETPSEALHAMGAAARDLSVQLRALARGLR